MGHFGSVLLDKERMKYEKTQTKEAWKAKVRAGTKPEGTERSGHQASNRLKSAQVAGTERLQQHVFSLSSWKVLF